METENALDQNLSDTNVPLLHVDHQRRLRRPLEEGDFRVEFHRFYLDDGSRYDVHRFLPSDPRYDIDVTATPPWCTDLHKSNIGSFNDRVGAKMALAGMRFTAVSPERLRPLELHRSLGNLSLLHDVHAQHAILNYIDEKEIAPNAPKQSISVGYSRGAMIGFGLNALSMQYGRDIRYSDYVDPCLEHKVRLRDINWLDVPVYMGEEIVVLAKGLSHYGPKEIVDMATTAAKPSVCFWLQQLALAKTLFSGEAGDFVNGWHPDSVAHVGLYTRSRFNHAADWQQRFSHLLNVDISKEAGMHLSGVDPRVLNNTIARVVLAQNLMKDGSTPAEIHAQILQWRPPQAKKKTIHLPHFPKLKVA